MEMMSQIERILYNSNRLVHSGVSITGQYAMKLMSTVYSTDMSQNVDTLCAMKRSVVRVSRML